MWIKLATPNTWKTKVCRRVPRISAPGNSSEKLCFVSITWREWRSRILEKV
jgi:hypothetical protein